MQRLSAQISDGVALLPAAPADVDPDAYYRGAIEQLQLKYVVGMLREHRATIGHNDSPSIDSSDFRITSVVEAADGLRNVHYALALQALWPLDETVPAAVPLIVPGRFEAFTVGGETNVASPTDERIYATFGASCVTPSTEPVHAGNAWYYYTPARSGCPLAPLAQTETGFVDEGGETFARFGLTFGQQEPMSGKRPDYAGLWRDGTLRVLYLSTPVRNAMNTSDMAVMNIQLVQSSLSQRYREIARTRAGVGANGRPLEEKITYAIGDGRKIELAILHAEGFWGHDAGDFFGRIAALSGTAGVVYYAGHSSYGSAIRRLADLVEVRPATPQIYFIDGCSTYFYSGQTALWDKVRAANPGDVPPGRFANLIVNGDAQVAFANGPNLSKLVHTLVERTETYRQFLSRLGHAARSVVIGEEANPE